MLPAKNRLNLSFTKIAGGNYKRLSGKEIELVYTKSKGVFKGAVVVSKKIAQRAVDRNRIKRLVAESLRRIPAKFEGKLAVIVKKNLAKFKQEEMDGLLVRQLKKIE